MNERFIIGGIGIFGFILIAFTGIVPIFLHQYGVDNVYIVKAVIGIASLVCGYAVLWGFFKKENLFKEKKDGKLHLRPIMLIAGAVLVALAWFTDVPLWIADYTGLSQTFDYEGSVLQGGIGTRLSVTILTAIGILLVKFSVYRDTRITVEGSNYTAMLDKKEEVEW